MRVGRGVRGLVGRGARSRGARHGLWMLMAAALLTTACFRQPDPEDAAEPPEPTYLRVDNQAFADMTIYAVRGSQRVRLGMANGVSTTRLRIPNSLLFGSSVLAFIADPIGGGRTPISQEITVSPGDEVLLLIPAR